MEKKKDQNAFETVNKTKFQDPQILQTSRVP